MPKTMTATLALPALLALLGLPVLVLAQPWGPPPYGPAGWQYRPQEPSNARGVSPAKLPVEEPAKTAPGTPSPPTPAHPGPPLPMATPGLPLAPPQGTQPWPVPPGMPSPMPPAMQPGMPPGMQPGIPPGQQPGMQPGMQPGQPFSMPQAASPYGYPAAPPAYPMGGPPPGWGIPNLGAYFSPYGASPLGQQPGAPTPGQQPATPPWGQQPSASPPGQQPPAPPPGQPPAAASLDQPPTASSLGHQPLVPSWGQQPTASPWGQPQPPAAVPTRSPWLEVELNEHQPYVQGNVLLRLRVVSDQNLITANPELNSANDLIIQKLDGPKASARAHPDGRREILTEFVYVLTPLRAGTLSLPALRVTGETAGDVYGFGRQRFDVSGGEGTQLQVREALAGVQPWRPLEDLRLTASLGGGEEVKAGEPLSLVLTLDAIGASGSQLPSLEALLTSPDYRVYREQTRTEAKVSADGQRLEGKRTETYTLVPRDRGRVHLPLIRIPWWNVKTGSRAWASLADNLGGEGMANREESLFFSAGAGLFWLALAVLLLPALGFGIGLWYRGRLLSPVEGDGASLSARLGRGARLAAGAAGRGLARVRDRLHPAPALRSLRQALQGMLPASSRFLACLGAANQERDPALWARHFQNQACRHLPVAAKAVQPGSLPRLAGQVLQLRPGADPDQLVRLLRQLDEALYGGRDIDFPRWKREFGREVGRAKGLMGFGHRARFRGFRIERPRLPELNPRPAG